MNRRCGAALAIALPLLLASGRAAAGEYAGTHGKFVAGVNQTDWGHDEMDIDYVPDPTKVTCSAIYLCQTVRATDQNGAVVQPKDIKPPGDIAGPFEHTQDDITDGGTTVDHKPTEKDPYYNGEDEGKDDTDPASTTGTEPDTTSMTDEPWTPDEWFPPGVTTIHLQFETCAVCKDNGAILDCLTWSYARIKGDPGHGTITGPTGDAAVPPSDEFKKAKAKFEKNHEDGKKCPEEKAEEHQGEKNAESGFHQVLPPFPHPMQPSQVLVDVVNSSGQPMNAIPWRAVDLGGTRVLASGTVPFLDRFSFATVGFAVPPVPSPAQTDQVVFTVDPANTIPEYDETDNAESIPIGYYGEVGVGETSPGGLPGRVAAWPNPFRLSTRVRFALAQPAAARVEVFDAAGVRVRTLHDGPLASGVRAFDWNGRDDGGRLVPAGIYWVRVKYLAEVLEQKLVLLR